MKQAKVTLLGLGLLLSSAAFAQKMIAVPAQKSGNDSRFIKAPPVPVAPAYAPASTDFGMRGVQPGSPGYTNTSRPVVAAVTGRTNDRKVSPELKSTDGVIRIDFGVAKQGDLIHTFFPFNIITLEPEETLTTPVLSSADYIRYSRFDKQSSVKDVKLTNGKLFHRGGAGSVMSGNGFDLAYQADKTGAVDEMVQVYTKQGNIIYRLTGYVLNKDTELSMK